MESEESRFDLCGQPGREKMLQDKVLEPLQTSQATSLPEAVPVAVLVRVTDFKDAVTKLIRGYALLLIDQEAAIYCSNVSKTKGRTIEEPGNEQIIRGSHEGFVENVDLNLYLVRLRIQNPNLVVKYHSVSETAPRNVSLLYINGLTNPKIVQLVEQKLKTIRVDFAAAPGTLQDYLDENPASLFPQFILTERPDRVAAHLMEGRVALLMQGSASALILPVTFFTFFQSPDDYNSRWMQGSFFGF
ncbi:spore germination protein [Paenibacillus larvae]|nr:spore germination protein [Paenibacillus larvae]